MLDNGCGQPAEDETGVYQMGTKMMVLCLLGLVLSVSILAYVPPVSRDALTHHLAVPKLWIENGKMVAFPQLPFSYYPMNLDLLYAIPMIFGNDILPKYIHFLFALLTGWLIYLYLIRRIGRLYSFLAVLLFLSTPIILKLSINVYVDLGLIFFAWASIYFLFAWARSPKSNSYLVLSAILCGLGLGTKYNGMIVLFLLTLFVPIVYIRSGDPGRHKAGPAIGYAILFLMIALTVFSPWMIRNARLTGNPIHPLFGNRIGNTPVSESSTITNMSMKPWVQRKLIYRESALETALIPIRIFFQGKDDNPQFFDGKLNPILLFFPIVLFLGRRHPDAQLRLEQFILSVFSILYLLYASFMVDMRIRYIAPIIPPLSILTVFGVGEMSRWTDLIRDKRVRAIGRGSIVVVVFFFLFINATYLVRLFQSVSPLPYILGETSREQYLSQKLPDYPAIQFINQIQSEPIKIFALFMGRRLYYFNKPVEFGNQSFARMVGKTTADGYLASQLDENGFTHCIVGIASFEAWANQTFAEDQKMAISQWIRDHCQLLFFKNGYAVFKLIHPAAVRVSLLEKGRNE